MLAQTSALTHRQTDTVTQNNATDKTSVTPPAIVVDRPVTRLTDWQTGRRSVLPRSTVPPRPSPQSDGTAGRPVGRRESLLASSSWMIDVAMQGLAGSQSPGCSGHDLLTLNHLSMQLQHTTHARTHCRQSVQNTPPSLYIPQLSAYNESSHLIWTNQHFVGTGVRCDSSKPRRTESLLGAVSSYEMRSDKMRWVIWTLPNGRPPSTQIHSSSSRHNAINSTHLTASIYSHEYRLTVTWIGLLASDSQRKAATPLDKEWIRPGKATTKHWLTTVLFDSFTAFTVLFPWHEDHLTPRNQCHLSRNVLFQNPEPVRKKTNAEVDILHKPGSSAKRKLQ